MDYDTTNTCPRCFSDDVTSIETMRLHTCDADPWVRCNECGHTFTARAYYY